MKTLLNKRVQATLLLRQHFTHFFSWNNCLLCHNATKTELTLCKHCLKKLPFLLQACSRCALPLEGLILHPECGQCLQKPPPFNRMITVFEYKSPIDKLIGDFKFHARLSNGHVLAKLLIQKISATYLENQLPELIIPVPLHTTRLRERGYNQAVELARPIAKAFNIPINQYDCRRIKSTEPQSQTSASDRHKNLHGAFQCAPLNVQHIAIIDDVVTTTSTVRELSQTLHKSGVKKIDIWCAARTIGRK